jgi:hypothetical protein
MSRGTAFSTPQFAQVVAGIALALPQVLAKYDPAAVLAACKDNGTGIEFVLDQAIGSLLTPKRAEQKPPTLTPLCTVSVTLTKPHDPAAFYRTRSGLYVYGDFRSRVGAKAKPVESAAALTLRRFTLARDASDADIEAGMGENHEFTEAEVCWVIAEMIAKQQNGEAGDLDNTGKANLFYTPSCLVLVYWFADGREWGVDTWSRGDGDWGAGDSAFSRN